jgi:hypothetical protein
MQPSVLQNLYVFGVGFKRKSGKLEEEVEE